MGTVGMGVEHIVVHGYRRAFRRAGAGAGQTLLLIHGIGDSSATWLPVFPQLAQQYEVIAPDLLGHGESDKPRADYATAAYACGMRDLLSMLDVERVTVVGHSLGGGVAMQFAYQFPERCERLVLVSTGGVAREVHPLLRLAAVPGADVLLALLTAAPVRLALRPVVTLARVFHLNPELAYVLRGYYSLADVTAREAFLRTLRAVVDFRGQVVTMLDRTYLTEGMPTLLLWGDRDTVVPVSHARLAHAAMPRSRLEIFPGVGHFPHHVDPGRFAAVVGDFLASTEPAEHDPLRWRTLLRAGRPPHPDDTTEEVLDRAAVSSGS